MIRLIQIAPSEFVDLDRITGIEYFKNEIALGKRVMNVHLPGATFYVHPGFEQALLDVLVYRPVTEREVK
jgi:hypothetical protein